MTWEDVLSLAGPAVPKRELWTALVPLLGYLALLRNLRNLDDAGVPDDVAARAAARLADPEQVRRSRVFPFRFLAAYQAVPSLRWAHALEQALSASLASVPQLTGSTLILVDRSGSMFDRPSAKSRLNRADRPRFGTALALRAARADLVEFGTGSAVVPFRAAGPVLKIVRRFGSLGGTNTAAAVAAHFRRGKHARVVIVTDEQAMGSVSPANILPEDVPLYTWNLAGYRYGHGPSGLWNRARPRRPDRPGVRPHPDDRGRPGRPLGRPVRRCANNCAASKTLAAQLIRLYETICRSQCHPARRGGLLRTARGTGVTPGSQGRRSCAAGPCARVRCRTATRRAPARRAPRRRGRGG